MKYIVIIALLMTVVAQAENESVYILEFHSEPLAVKSGKNLSSQKALNHKQQLMNQHHLFISSLNNKFKKTKSVKFEYFYAFNGLALSLNKEQLLWVNKSPEIKSISKSVTVNLHTDIGPQWIGADNVWNGLSLDTPGNKGEGVVIGVIDTGIYPQHPSFQEISQPGTPQEYHHINPRGQYYGLCNDALCNNKLIGIYDYTTSNNGADGIDTVGHGSHVAGIAAGNIYTTEYQGLDFTVSGVAPRANIISYKACQESEDAAGGSCGSAELMAAIDQATADQVDVVNYSIGSDTPCSPWGGLDGNGNYCGEFSNNQTAAAMLNARSAGVLFVVSAGNAGPGKSTVGYPAVAPWVLTAANSTHSRQLQSLVTDFTGGSESLQELVGASATEGIGPLRIVHARDYGNALCGQGDPELKSQCSGTGNDVLTGISNPFPANTFNGEIVVCDRGSYGRVEKGFNVKQSGAAGYILANTVGQQESIVADQHCLPATHLGNIAGTQLRNWLESGTDHMARITGQNLVYENDLGDIMNSSSSRGPVEIIYNSFNSNGGSRVLQSYMKPNLSAPGTSVLSADYLSDGLVTKSGTSMSAPHISGSVALIKSGHPDFTASQVISSLILTADNTQMRKEDGLTPADFNDQGSGRTRVDSAFGNTLSFDVSYQQFINFNPQNGADITQLNLPEIINNNCYPSCSFTRNVKKISSYNVVDPVWQVFTEQYNGLDISVTPDSFDFNDSNEVTLNININTTANDVIGNWAEAKIVFEVVSSSNSDPLPDTLAPSLSKLPVAVYVPSGNYPELVSKNTTNRHGTFDLGLTNITPMTGAVYQGSHIIIPEVFDSSLIATNNQGPFDSSGILIESNDSGFSLFEITEDKIAVIIESSGSGLTNLYVGQDLNINDIPDEYEVLCEDTGFDNNKQCVLKNVRPGRYWILSDNRISANNFIRTRLATFTINDTAKKASFKEGEPLQKGSGLYVEGPVKTDSVVDLKVYYELPAQNSESGEYYGVIAVGADLNSIAKTAVIPVKISANSPVNEKIFSLNNEVAEFNFTQGQALSDIYIDTGLDANNIILESLDRGFEARLYKTDFNFNPLDIKPDLSSMTPDITVFSMSPYSGTPPAGSRDIHYAEIDISNYPASRWYIEVFPEGNSGYVALDASVNYEPDELIIPEQSLWYNPSRSGWGIDLSRTDTSQAVTWYTYNDDGSIPTWYQATGVITGQNQWSGTLNRVSWDGTHPRIQVMGHISLVYINKSSSIISISLPDATYTEPLTSLYSSGNACPQVNPGQQLDITGLWYLPEQSGFGYTVLATDTTENAVLYFYSDDGQPVWVIGNRSFEDNEIIMSQVTDGFCPGCVYSPISLSPAGTLINVYNSEMSGSSIADIQFLSPVVGHWQTSGNSIKLNTNFGCNTNQ